MIPIITREHRRLLTIVEKFGPIALSSLRREDKFADTRPLRYRIADMVALQLVRTFHATSRGRALMVDITSVGVQALAAPQGLTADEATAQRAHLYQGGTYDGKELRPFTARPGAVRAFALPSVVDGKPVERRLPISLASAGEERPR